VKALIEIEKLKVQYGKQVALELKHLVIPQAQITGIVGPNGSGKSSLLKAMLDLVPHSGSVKIQGTDLKSQKERVSYVPQKEAFDWNFPINVFDLVLMGRYGPRSFFVRSSGKDKAIALEAIELVDMLKYKDRQIGELSGGQQQRVLIARALAKQAELLLLDEPFAGIDASTETKLLSLFEQLKDQGKSIVMVHHDLLTAKNYFDFVVLLNNSLVADGNATETLSAQNLERAYGGSFNFTK
jgi:manganese/zinc/iron transport system ATP- binding protein